MGVYVSVLSGRHGYLITFLGPGHSQYCNSLLKMSFKASPAMWLDSSCCHGVEWSPLVWFSGDWHFKSTYYGLYLQRKGMSWEQCSKWNCQSLARLLASSIKWKCGWVRKFQTVKQESPENPFYWCWCWTWQLPLSKNYLLLMAVGQDADTGTCQRQTAQVTAALVKWAWRQTPRASGGLDDYRQAAALCRQFIGTGFLCLPHPSGLGLRTHQKCRWHI